MGEDAVRAGAVVRAAAEDFGAELDEQVGRRHPANLHAIVAVLVAEEGLVGQRPVVELVGMRVVAVEIADIGEEATAAQGEAVRQRDRFDESFLDAELVLAIVAAHRQRQLAVELVVDIGRHRQLAFSQRDALRTGAAFAYQRKARARVVVGVERVMADGAVEHDGDRGIEGIAIGTGGAAVRFGRGLVGRDGCFGGRSRLQALDFGIRRLQRGLGIGDLLAQGIGIRLQRLHARFERGQAFGVGLGLVGGFCAGNQRGNDAKGQQGTFEHGWSRSGTNCYVIQ